MMLSWKCLLRFVPYFLLPSLAYLKGQQAYHDLTHGTGFYRDVFKIFKPMFDRIIMLGVSPITLDDLTSGYNIALNMTIDSRFNQMLGFSEDEVRQMMDYILKAYHDTTAVRQLIEGERNLQGFINAFLSLAPYYLVAPEMEFSHGYCDFFLLLNYTVYPMVAHSYILELKYLKVDATDAEAAQQWTDAVAQIKTYATDAKLQSMLHGTQLHLIVVQIKGYDVVKMEEIR